MLRTERKQNVQTKVIIEALVRRATCNWATEGSIPGIQEGQWHHVDFFAVVLIFLRSTK